MPMKKVILCSVVFFILNMLHISPTRAQDWQISQSTTVHTSFQTETYAQKVRVFNNDYLVGITKVAGNEHYGFVLWENTNTIERIALLGTPDIIINDFAILGNDLYFCGQRMISQGFYVGIIGCFNMIDFINNGNFQYEYTDINTIENLTKIITFKTHSDEQIVTAIGNGSFILPTFSQVVCLNLSNPNSIAYTLLPLNNQSQLEVLWDMYYYDDYVITVSNIHLADEYIIRYFRYDGHYLDNIESYSFTFPGVDFNSTFDPMHFPLHIADISQYAFAVCLSANDGYNFFTMINTHKMHSHFLLNSQIHYHEDKNNEPLEMEYSSNIDRLLLLNNNYFSSLGKIQTMTYIDPNATNTYLTLMEYFNTPSEINHFSLVSPDHYAVAGTYSFSQSNNLQLFATRDIHIASSPCLNNSLVKINPFPITDGQQYSNVMGYNIFNINWITDNIFVNTEIINKDCED